MSITHATFVIDRTYDASLERVYRAWSDPKAKAQWFSCHEDATWVMDFRVGGKETYRGGPKGGPVYENAFSFEDIVPNERIVYTYSMLRDGVRISVSLVTVEFKAEGDKTRLVFTEQGAYLDGHDSPKDREHGTRIGFDHLAAALAR